MMWAEQLPPFDQAAEESVVASVMVDTNAMARVAGIVTPRDFFREANAWTYEACVALWERDEGINQVTVAHELEQRGRLDDVGGLAYLTDLINDLPTPIGVEHSAAIVKRDAMYRQMLSGAMDIARVAYEADPNFAKSLARAETIIHGLRSETKATDLVRLREYLDGYMDEPEDAAPLRVGGAVDTGLAQLDALLGGMRPGNLVIVAARTSVGKTALMLNFARNAAVTQHARVAVFSLEMTGEELAQRFVQSEARLTKEKLERGRYTEEEMGRLFFAIGLLGEAEIYIDSTPSLTPAELRMKCLKLANERGLDLVIVDYLQKMGGGSSNRYETVTNNSGKLKEMAVELDVPFIVGCQLSRAVEGRVGHRPMLSDLRESGAIEQDADVVLFIHREDRLYTLKQWQQAHKPTEPYPESQAQLIVAKYRNGQLGDVTVRMRQQFTRFEDFDVAPATPVQGRAW